MEFKKKQEKKKSELEAMDLSMWERGREFVLFQAPVSMVDYLSHLHWSCIVILSSHVSLYVGMLWVVGRKDGRVL